MSRFGKRCRYCHQLYLNIKSSRAKHEPCLVCKIPLCLYKKVKGDCILVGSGSFERELVPQGT